MVSRKKDPLRNYKFKVEIQRSAGSIGTDFTRLGFSNIDGLSAETSVIEYREGGDMSTPRKIPGQTKFDNLTLERGKSDKTEGGEDMISWFNEVFSRTRGFSQPLNDDFRRKVTITLHDKAGNKKVQWVAHECWICRLEHEALDARDEGDIFIERMELCNEGIVQTLF